MNYFISIVVDRDWNGEYGEKSGNIQGANTAYPETVDCVRGYSHRELSYMKVNLVCWYIIEQKFKLKVFDVIRAVKCRIEEKSLSIASSF